MRVDFYHIDNPEDNVGRWDVPILPRIGETVHIRKEDGTYLDGMVQAVYWGDMVDGNGEPLGSLGVAVELA